MHPSHELVVATADEIRLRGAGLILQAGIAESPFGRCLIADSPRGICCLSFLESKDKRVAIAELHNVWPLADVRWDSCHARTLADGIFKSGRGMCVFVAGTDFQVRIWRELIRIPMGGTLAYGELAAIVGNPRAARATGSAVGANPVSFMIPCHRIIRGNGATGHYHWGADRKRAMLDWEGARAAGN